MTWTAHSVAGAMPTWHCESCTTRRDKCCAFTMNLLAAFDIYSKDQFLPRRNGDQQELARALTPMMQVVENGCRYSSKNMAPKKEPDPDNSFSFDVDNGERVYLSGRREPMQQDDYRHVRENG